MASPSVPPPDTTPDLAMAVIASSSAPMLLLDGELRVIAASMSFCRAFHLDNAEIPGHLLAKLGAGEWSAPQLTSLLEATSSGAAEIEAYEMDLRRKGQPTRHLVLNAHRLEYGESANVRLLLSVSDVTDARASAQLKDDLVREKVVLLQELQHRVANSLQIIASVLLQSARNVQSDESKSHLHAAHHRVMSVAAVQQQLSVSSGGDVALRPYFTKLCASLGASMIHDHTQLTLVMETDDSPTSADISVSLGLIVTELVINALKHAFPGHRTGTIAVSYKVGKRGWTLSVRDDGVGFDQKSAAVKAGLGTSIVNALAKQLHAAVQVIGADPGTRVSIVHMADAATTDDAEANLTVPSV